MLNAGWRIPSLGGRGRRALLSLGVVLVLLLPPRAAAAASWEDAAWSAWQSNGAVTSTPVFTSWGAGRLDAVARGSDGSIYHRWWTGGAWSSWEALGGTTPSAPAVVAPAPGTLYIAVRGTDGAVWALGYTNGSWGTWQSLGGTVVSAPAVVSSAPGQLDVFGRGADNGLYHKWRVGTSWYGWEPLGGQLTSAPAAVSWGSGRIDVVARGTDGGLYHEWYSGGWHGWESLGGRLVGDPTITSWSPGRLDIFVEGTDFSVYHAWFDGAWAGWESLGGGLLGSPTSLATQPGNLDVTVRGTDSGVWQIRYRPASWSAFVPLGLTPTTNQILDVPYDAQVYELSCEEASLQMALAHENISVSQGQELASEGVDPRAGYYDASGVLHWGDPYASFVGDVNGSEVTLTGYGTYDTTIDRIANGYGGQVLAGSMNFAPGSVYAEVLAGHPVVAWVSFDYAYHGPGSMLAWDGNWVQWEGPVEHTVAVVGVTPSQVLVYNPWYGIQWISRSTFEQSYATYHDMAVVLQ